MLVSGCDIDDGTGTESDTAESSDSETDTSGEQDACAIVPGKTYGSVTQRECGLGPNGPEPCTWTVEFVDDENFSYMYSDRHDIGTYTCDGLNIIAQGGNDGVLDIDTGELTWNGSVYTEI